MAGKRQGRTKRNNAARSKSAKNPGKPAFPDPAMVSTTVKRSVVATAAAAKRRDKERLAAAAAWEPLDYRVGHGALSDDRGPAVERHGPSLPDVNGDIGNPHRTYDTLATLWRNGSIDASELQAGRAFEEDFIRARLNTLHASNPARIPSAGVAELSDAMIAGRRRINRVMTALGGVATPAGSSVWCILGSGQSVKEWAATCQFSGGRRSLHEKVAKGIFVSALGMLAVHYEKQGR